MWLWRLRGPLSAICKLEAKESWRMKLQSKLKGLRARGANIRPSLTPQKVRKDQWYVLSKSKGRPKNQKHQGLRVGDGFPAQAERFPFTFLFYSDPWWIKACHALVPCTGRVSSSLSLQIQMPVSTRNTLTDAPGNHIFQLSGHLLAQSNGHKINHYTTCDRSVPKIYIWDEVFKGYDDTEGTSWKGKESYALVTSTAMDLEDSVCHQLVLLFVS